MRLALYQPDIPQNTGTLLRLGACLGVPVDIIEPCGFPFSERGLRRSGLDYIAQADFDHHPSWDVFQSRFDGARRVLLTTQASCAYTDFRFEKTDILLLGRESGGVPEAVHLAADARLCVRLRPGLRSLNVAVAAAMVLGEGLRQTDGFTTPEGRPA